MMQLEKCYKVMFIKYYGGSEQADSLKHSFKGTNI